MQERRGHPCLNTGVVWRGSRRAGGARESTSFLAVVKGMQPSCQESEAGADGRDPAGSLLRANPEGFSLRRPNSQTPAPQNSSTRRKNLNSVKEWGEDDTCLHSPFPASKWLVWTWLWEVWEGFANCNERQPHGIPEGFHCQTPPYSSTSPV